MFNNPQKGVSLIITFFISIIILFIVLSVSVLLYSEIKIIRNIGNSVSAFYVAESGIEKVLYYDRKNTVGDTRGICNICNSESGVPVCPDCLPCEVQALDTALVGCNPETCSKCRIIFSTQIDPTKEQYYNVDIAVDQQCKISFGTISSYGFYEKASRAIKLDSAMKASSLVLSDADATINVHGKVLVTVTVFEPPGITTESVVAAIYGLGDDPNCDPDCSPEPCCMYREITLQSGGDGTWSKPWNDGLTDEPYTINIMAWDNLGYCVEISDVTVTP